MDIKIFYDQNHYLYYGQYLGPVPGDHLVGGFYEMTIQTRQGLASGTFLFYNLLFRGGSLFLNQLPIKQALKI